MPARKLIAVALAAGAVVAGLVLWVGGDDDTGAETAGASAVDNEAGPVFLRDGRLESADLGRLPELAELLRRRTPGLVVVAGTVRNMDSGEPVGGAEVVFAGPAGETSTAADSEGRYALQLHPGFYRAFARADGQVAVAPTGLDRIPGPPTGDDAGMPVEKLAPVIGAFRDQAGVDLHLHPGGAIRGTVFDGDGRPIAGAVVAARSLSRGGTLRMVLGTDIDVTDIDGSFRLEVPAGTVILHASHDDYAGLAPGSRARMHVAAGSEARADLTLTAGCIITGQAVDGRGQPAGPGALEAWIGGAPPNDFTPVGRLDDQGRFRLASAAPGEMKLRAWPWKSPPSAPMEFDCDEGVRYRDVVFRIPQAEPALEGTLWSEGGQPIPDAYVDLYPLSPGGMAQQERADSYGDWAFYALPAGTYQLTAYVPGHGVAALPVEVPGRGYRLELSGTGTLVGTVRDLGNGSFTLVLERCAVRNPDDTLARLDQVTMPETRILVPVESGTYRVDNLPACALSARAELPDRSVPIHADISPHEPATANL
jgi:hypothetical protein